MIRKKFIIYPKFQLTLIAVNVFVFLVCFSFILAEHYLGVRQLRQLGIDYKLSLGHPYFRFLDVQSWTMLSHALIATGLGLFTSVTASILLSHRLAGPLVRLNSYFKTIESTGKVPEEGLKFRKSDYLYPMTPTINAAIQKIQTP